MALTLDLINQVCLDLGGTGGHKMNIDALNEVCTLLGGTGGHERNIDALNEIQGSVTYKQEIDALNAIITDKGGTSGPYTMSYDAWQAIQQGSLLNPLQLVTPPTGFPITTPFDIFRHASTGAISMDETFDLETYADITVAKTYYVAPNGSDSNNGLTSGAPLLKLSTALGKADVDKVILAAGWYTFANGTVNINPARPVKIIGTGNTYLTGDVFYQLGAWTHTNNHYNITYAVPVSQVLDISINDAFGDFKKLVCVGSESAVEATAGTWYQGGGVLYIRNFDDRTPDTNNKLLYGAGFTIAKNNLKYYIENIKFYFPSGNKVENESSVGGTKFYAKNCSFKYSLFNNIVLVGVSEAIFENVISSAAGQDGISYGSKNGVESIAYEINTHAYNNGVPSGTAYNGSTAHNSSKIVRINCHYHHNRGSNVMDIQSCLSWNLGCNSHHSEPFGTPDAEYRANYSMGGGTGSVKAWCDTCISSNSYTDFVSAISGSVLYKHNCTGDAGDVELTGDIQEY